MESGRQFDTVIIGGGPGGYTAAMYAVRSGLSAIVLEKLSAGGQMALTHQIDNYPGFEEGIDGFLLAEKMQQQAHRFGAVTEYATVLKVDLLAQPKVIETSEGIFYGKTVVIATGAGPKELGLPGEKELVGKGVAYCAACDGMFFRGKTVAVVGGGDSAVADALILSRVAKEVILIHRRDTLRATKVYHQQLLEAGNIRLQMNTQVVELLREEKLRGLCLQDSRSGQQWELPCDGVFISVGRKPATEQLSQLQLQDGYILAGEDTCTSIPGVYAVGDVRTKPLRQIVTAVADGAVAIHQAELFLSQN